MIVEQSANGELRWKTDDYEHELQISPSRTLDLKADFGLHGVVIDDQKVSLELLSRTDLVCLQWDVIQNLRLKQTGPVIVAGDGMSGLMGIRLVGADRRRLDFEIWADWFEMSLTCERFRWDHRAAT